MFNNLGKKIGVLGYTGLSSYLVLFLIDIISILFKASDPNLNGTAWSFSKYFFLAILILFFLGVGQLLFRIKKLNTIAGAIPSHMTAIGILGTFFGIFIGLYKFDVKNLHTSVPLLLDGMKLAFSTSIAGLSASTFLKVTHSVYISVFQFDDPFEDNRDSPEISLIIDAIDKNNSATIRRLDIIIQLLEELNFMSEPIISPKIRNSFSKEIFEDLINDIKSMKPEDKRDFDIIMKKMKHREALSKLEKQKIDDLFGKIILG
ncbi:MAG: hypothetical protein KKE61_07210 [Proteobacteria bacterium]|nr:hypothetical protein [Pseudomonadota bacterium]